MVKTPKMRHSTTKREPLTIDLGPEAVSRASESAPVDNANESIASPEAVAENIGESGTTTHIQQDEQASAAQEPAGYGFDSDDQVRTAEPLRNAPPPTAAPASDGFSRIAAGVIGAVVALVLAGALQFAGILGAPGTAAPDQNLQAEIDALKQQVSSVQAGAAPGDLAARTDALSASLDTVKADLTTLQQTVAAGGAGDASGVPALDARVKAIETALTQFGQGGSAPTPVDTADLAAKIAAVETAVKAAGDTAAADAARIAVLEQSIASFAAKVDGQAAQPKVALAIATAALKSAIERGAPFAAELETLAALAPDAPEIATLRSYAEKGVASREALIEATEPAAVAMIAAAAPVDPNAGFFDSLLKSAGSLVTVRPIGSVEGAGVDAIVARMEAAIKSGEFNKAVAEFDTLPDASKAAAGAFADMLKSRQAVDKLAGDAIAAAMKA